MRIKMQGFIVFDFLDQYAEAKKDLAQWAKDGKLKVEQTVVKAGLKGADATLKDLFSGINKGKLIVELKNPQELPKL